MKTSARIAATTAVAAAMLAGFGAARAATLPAVRHSGDVQFMTGGIGRPEAEAIEQAGRQWPLTLEFAEKDGARGEFVADVDAVVRDAAGRSVLQVDDTGPFVLARLASGRYVVDATLNGKTLHRAVRIDAGKPTKVVFEWPAGADRR